MPPSKGKHKPHNYNKLLLSSWVYFPQIYLCTKKIWDRGGGRGVCQKKKIWGRRVKEIWGWRGGSNFRGGGLEPRPGIF